MDLATTPWTAAVATLAVWRGARLLSVDAGPGGVLAALRARAGSALDCLHCTTLWCAAPAALWLADGWPERAVWWLALSAAAIGLDELLERWPDQPLLRFAEDAPAATSAQADADAWADTQADAFVVEPAEGDADAEARSERLARPPRVAAVRRVA